MENLKKSSFQANISTELHAQLNELRTELRMTAPQLLEFLYSFHQKPFRSDLNTNQKLEKEIVKALKGTKKITPYSLRMIWGKNSVGAENVKACMKLYELEIEEHNKKFSE